jgi:uncharacterized protein YidB (DUF937 family)
MSSVISPSAVNYGALFSASGAASWLGDTLTAIQNQQNQGGLIGMLQNSGGDGSISSFIGASQNSSNQLALIAQNSVTNKSSLVAQMASQNIQQQNQKKLQDAIAALSASQQVVQPTNVLDPVIFFGDGSSLDTNSNVMTMSDGTQIDTTTGAKVVDTASLVQMANGAYLDTKNNILTMPDGSKIDTITGLKISVTA